MKKSFLIHLDILLVSLGCALFSIYLIDDINVMQSVPFITLFYLIVVELVYFVFTRAKETRKRIIYLFAFSLLATLVSLLFPRETESCEYLGVGCFKHIVRGFPIGAPENHIQLLITISLVNLVLTFLIISVIYFTYLKLFTKRGKK